MDWSRFRAYASFRGVSRSFRTSTKDKETIMKWKVATLALACAAFAPHAVLAQGTNTNDCSILPSGGSSSGDITVEATAEQFGQIVSLSAASVTFPTTLANDPVIDAYNSGAFGLVPGENLIFTQVEVLVDTGLATSEGTQSIVGGANVTVDIVDEDGIPGNGNEYLLERDATIPLSSSNWSPTQLNIEFTQSIFIVMSGGITIDCAPTSASPIPFASITVETQPCDEADTCNDNGTCNFWGTCDCFEGFDGPGCACEDAVTCSGNGECNAAGDCVCSGDFGGPDCSCSDSGTCNGNGFCDGSGACVCDAEWTGADCLTPSCVPETDCSGNGICIAGECLCGVGYTGTDCSTQICDPATECNGIPVAVGNLRPVLFDDGLKITAEGSTIAWQDRNFSFYGQTTPINLGAASGINTMLVPDDGGFITPNPSTSPVSGKFVALYESSSVGALDLYVEGDYICPDNPGPGACGDPTPWVPYPANFVTTVANLSGSYVDDGTLPTTSNGAPITYVIDGALLCALYGVDTICNGTGFLNAFRGITTPVSDPPGTPVTVTETQFFTDPSDPSGQTVVPIKLDITYDAVETAGFTTVASSSQQAGTISSDFSIDALGFGPVFFDVTKSEGFTGDVTICFEYPDTLVDECDIRLLHNADGGDDKFEDATLGKNHEDCPFTNDDDFPCANDLCINTATKVVCGGASSLSPWAPAVFVGNEAPVADAGPDQAIQLIGTLVELDGSSSYDPDGDPITYAWVLSVPDGSMATLAGADSAKPSFTPDVYGEYAATLTVTDPDGLSDTDEVLVSFENVPPVADAMAYPQSVRVGEVVLLDASGSEDANGDPLSYEWSLVAFPTGSSASIADPTAETTTLTPDVAGTYQIDLIVSDGLADSEIASVMVVATTAEGELVEALEAAIDMVNALDPTTFKNKALQKNMAKHIAQALAHVDNGKFQAARNKLEAVLRKTDGCAASGSPDPNDWIVDCGAQSQVQPLIAEAIALIDEILGQ
jgi:hypothetical protein